MIQGKFLFCYDDLSPAYEIRKKVFQEEYGIDANIDQDGLDPDAGHVIVFNNLKVVGTGRLVFSNNNYKIGRVAVLKEERCNYYGDFVVRMLVDKAFQMGAEEVYLHSMINCIPFYEKIGFEKIGDVFQEAGIDHIKMILKSNKICKKCCN